MLYLCFSRWLCYPACLRAPHPVRVPGIFDVPPVLHTRTPRYSELYYTVSARCELMTAASELLLLDPDAFYRAYIDARPYRDFKSPASEAKAKMLYPNGQTPYDDLLQCAQGCSFKWRQIIQPLL